MGTAASTAYRLGQDTSGSPTVAAGLGGVATAASASARRAAGSWSGLAAAADRGRQAAFSAGTRPRADAAGSAGGAPEWARRLRSEQAARHHRHAALQAIRDGDRGGASANPDIKEKED
jgi:type IV secretion system protein TrbL